MTMYLVPDVSVPQMFSHQFPFPLSSNENAVPEHQDSPSEGSENYSFGAPAAGDAFGSDGSVDSGIGSLAANDEPYLPSRPQAAPTGHPSPLNYSVAPDYVASHSEHTSGVSLSSHESPISLLIDYNYVAEPPSPFKWLRRP
ncbi:hypothetical protein P691DRAFT_536504 [Macrolepiota fuliginosa MF-IS2]|uniref:Uncharacterized protein n=1 Tax=Macrolepiota fuliginosa MF-IS2 TaxID=1400762 RepID=A0A9P6BXU4_9AGAR|nr:hypothetical protein P691DRAFT_536504 [Macrolepiota fuliginosa MF-IS2]